MRGKVGNPDRSSHAVQKKNQVIRAFRKLKQDFEYPTRFQRQSTLGESNLINPQGSEWNQLFKEVMKTTSQPKVKIL